MREYYINLSLGLPVVSALIAGPKRTKRVRLVFDTGSFMTQIHEGTMKSIGFSLEGLKPNLSIKGVTGPHEDAYSLQMNKFFVLGSMFNDISIATVDFKDWTKQGIDGLLGFDIIKHFHLEMDGPNEKLMIY